MTAAEPAISSTMDQDAALAARAHAVVPGRAAGCPQCIEFAAAFNRARNEAGRWRTAHRKAVEREKELKQEIEELKAKVKLRERQLFGKKSEKGGKGAGKDSGKGKDKEEKKRKRGQQKGTTGEGHGRRLHEHLDVKEHECDLAEGEKCCSDCGLPYEDFPGTDDSEEVEVEVRAYRRKYRRKRYKPTCNCPSQPGIVTAPGPAKLIPKGGYAVSFWAHVLLDKFLFQRPTYRLLTDLEVTTQLRVSQGTATDGLKRLIPLFVPLFDEIVAKSRSEKHWHADETRWKVFEELVGKQGNGWYLWVFCSASAVVFILDPSRSSAVPQDYFQDVAGGIVSVDRYAAYKTMLEWGRLLLQFCWAHVRRDFLAVAKDWKNQEEWAFEWLELIRKLYRLNDERVKVLEDPGAFAEADKVLRKAVDQMKSRWVRELADDNLHPARRKVLESLERHWSGLLVFVDHPKIPMDNNTAERAARNPAVGRKNYYGSGAFWSGGLAAILFSLFQTLLLWNINPRAWLTAYLHWCAECGGDAPDNAGDFLPWNMSEGQREVFAFRDIEEKNTS